MVKFFTKTGQIRIWCNVTFSLLFFVLFIAVKKDSKLTWHYTFMIFTKPYCVCVFVNHAENKAPFYT